MYYILGMECLTTGQVYGGAGCRADNGGQLTIKGRWETARIRGL